MIEGGERRDDHNDVGVTSPLHKVTENHDGDHHDTIRKPPPTAEANGGKAKRDNSMSSNSSSSGGDVNGSDNDNFNASCSSSGSKGESNSGESSERHVVTATGNSNSSSGDDRGSSDRGSSSRDTLGRSTTSAHHDLHHSYNRDGSHIHHDLTKEDSFNCGKTIPEETDVNASNGSKESKEQVAIKEDNKTMKFSDDQNEKNIPSENGSDGGYAGSASSNDVFENTSSTSDSVSSNEGCHASKTPRRDEKLRPIPKKSSPCSSSSSEIADFSSGVSDSGDPNTITSSKRHSTSSYLLADSLSDDSDSGLRTNKGRQFNNGDSKRQVSHVAVGKHSSIPLSKPSQHESKRRKRPQIEERGNESLALKKKKVARTKSTCSSSELQEKNGKYNIPSSWEFIERTIKKKATSLVDLHRKLSRQQNYDNLKQNYDTAMKRYVNSDSSSSLSHASPVFKDSACSSLSFRAHSSNTPIYNVGVDVMAKILSYLKPMEANRMLSEPFSKTFRATFSMPQDVWKILCLSEPFYATVDKSCTGGDDSSSSYPLCNDVNLRHILGKYRLLYSSFVRCITYLERIKDDAINGRMPHLQEKNEFVFQDNSSLQRFFARARDVARSESDSDISSSSLSSENQEEKGSKQSDEEEKSKVKYGSSKLTRSLLGPAHNAGIAGDLNLPSSCAVYSIVNWMVAFADVAGIQTMCMHVLPILLEDDEQRTTAQHAGLTDIVLRAMVLFPNNADLHTSAFHTLVLLARPIGGKEGMIFYRAMVNASGIFNIGSNTGKSGIAIMMDSMKRFSSNEKLQAMSCWSMVNIALIQSQKIALVRLGGISAAGNAMMQHPSSPDVQFRALFALINLVIPSENLPENSLEADIIREQVGEVNQNSETDMLDESVEFVTNLVVVAMKNFCSNMAILNRACLVLHNLSLNVKYHNVLLWTPNCYQMVEWCIENYKQDKVLQQSARGTLQRLQMTLSNDETLRLNFAETIRAQQQSVVENAMNNNQENE